MYKIISASSRWRGKRWFGYRNVGLFIIIPPNVSASPRRFGCWQVHKMSINIFLAKMNFFFRLATLLILGGEWLSEWVNVRMCVCGGGGACKINTESRMNLRKLPSSHVVCRINSYFQMKFLFLFASLQPRILCEFMPHWSLSDCILDI